MILGQVEWSEPAVLAHELADLHQTLSRKYRLVDAQLLDEAIEEALMRYLAHPDAGLPRA